MDVLSTLLLAVVSIVVAVLLAVFYALVIWWFDRYEKEPWGLLAAAFVWGAIPAVLLSLTAELLVSIPASSLFGEAAGQFIAGSGVAPVVEEVAKAFALLALFLVFRREFDGLLDGIVYGALVGFGFGMTENVLYFLGGLAEGDFAGWLTIVFMRTAVFGLNHGLFTGIVGLGFGYASMASTLPRRVLAPVLALGGAITAHAVHNTFTTLGGELCWPILISLLTDWLGVLSLVAIILLSWDRERKMIMQYLRDETERGTLSQTEYETVASYSRRVAAQRKALAQHGLGRALRLRKFYQLATELAFAKHRSNVIGGEEAHEADIARLRGEIWDLRAEMAG